MFDIGSIERALVKFGLKYGLYGVVFLLTLFRTHHKQMTYFLSLLDINIEIIFLGPD